MPSDQQANPSHFIHFLRAFLRNPTRTGAIAPSSAHLARAITEAGCVREAAVVVELGTGTGVITEVIASRLRPGGRVIGVELNPAFVASTRARCPGVTVHHRDATDLRRILDDEGIEHCDAIVSGLPWAAFPAVLQDQLMDAMLTALRPGGRFVTFAYLQGLLLPPGRRFRRLLGRRFNQVGRTGVVWRNLPPAFVYWADK
ncbi:MAG: methyltransferase domain-containing protein [Vicinamibacteria bacterium]|jgi:phospholipid N-methyltransferase|nr:methyltransferase domain-containing protein [Vicinamibacteria bacterium]